MANSNTNGPAATDAPQPDQAAENLQKSKKREIKGGLPYTVYPNALKKALEAIVTAERPDRFSSDFLSTVLKVSGGSGRPIGPMLKKMHFISSDGTPTDLYSKFKTDSGRSQAALDGLKNAYSELFRRNEFIHRAETNNVKDLIVEITGLNKNDNITRLILQTFETIRSFSDKSSLPSSPDSGAQDSGLDMVVDPLLNRPEDGSRGRAPIGLSYHINIVLPETENIAVFNAIFRSIRENLLGDL